MQRRRGTTQRQTSAGHRLVYAAGLGAAAAFGWLAAGWSSDDPSASLLAFDQPAVAEYRMQPDDAPAAGDEVTTDDSPWRSDREIARRLNTDQIDEALSIIRELDPDRAERFERLRERDPRAFERALTTRARGITGLVWMKDRNPELYELKLDELRLDKQVRDLGRAIRESDSVDRDSMIEELRGLVRQQVNLSLRVRAEELLMLENHVKSMRDQLRRDSVNLERTVADRVRRIMDRADRDDRPRAGRR